MAPTATTSTASGTPTAMPIDSTPTLSSGFAGEEFINNLGSDLAPLLTLFGEQVTKQFLSMSLGWADHILLAVGPLGIITTVVSAIRVSNVRVLKAIIGRAREKLATAELELLSSTSDATSELWTEEGIVRQPGHATILEMVTYKRTSSKMASSQVGTQLEALSETHIGDISEAYNVGVLSPAQEGRWRRFKALVGKFERMFWSAFPNPSQTETSDLKDLAKLHEVIVMMNATLAICEDNLDELAEQAEIDMLTEHAGSDSGQNAWSADHQPPLSTYQPTNVHIQSPSRKTIKFERETTSADRRDIRDEIIAKERKATDQWITKTAAATGVAQDLVRRLANQPPNLILNVHNTFPKSGELWAFAMIGMALQFVAVLIPAIMTYHWKEPKDTKPVQDYAYPIFLLGTCLLFVSIALCSYIIEATTVEQVFTPTDGYRVENIFRLQLQQNMGDQPFNTYLILNHAEDKKIRTSRYDPAQQAGKSRAKAQKSTVIIAVSLCFVGFICQFVGLRALHWSATVIQLGITLLMTCIRAWIRRGISNQPITIPLPKSDPNWLALSLGTACRSGWPRTDMPWPTNTAPKLRFCEELPETRSVPVTGLISIDDPRIQLRRKLQSSSTTSDSEILPQAQALLSSMNDFFMWLHPRAQSRTRPIKWSHIVESSGLDDTSLQNSRVKLIMSFNLNPFRKSKQEVLNGNNLHALLSILRYESRPLSPHRCVTRVYSHEDWRRKRDFLVAQFPESTMEGGYLHHIGYCSNKGDLSYFDQRDIMVYPRVRATEMLAGTSIENMQPATGSSIIDSSTSYGYLVVRHQISTTTNHVFELLAGFMDAACQDTSLKYDPTRKGWYVEYEGSRQQMESDHIMNMFESLKPIVTETEARLLVVSSLARCTVWKDSVPADEPNPASVPLPKPSSRATLQRPSSSQSSLGFF